MSITTAPSEPAVTSNGRGGTGTYADSRSGFGRWTPRGFVGFVMLFTGIASLIHEYIISTIFTYLLGNSIEQFSITIGVMMAAMGVGAYVQKIVKDDSLADVFILTEFLLVIVGGFAPIALQWAYVALPNSFELIKFAYMALPGLLIGFEIPLVTRINERWAKNLGTNLSETWSWDYFGGFLGVFVWIALLRLHVPLTEISFWIAGCNLIVAVVALAFFWKRGMLRWRLSGLAMTLVSLAVVLAVFLGVSNADAWSRMATQRLYDDPIEVALTTKYQSIVLTRGGHPTDPYGHSYAMWLNGNKQFDSGDEAIYHENLVHPAMNLAAQRERVLILGGGDGMALREVLKYDDVQEVTLVDLDPEMIEFSATNPIMRDLNQDAFQDARVTSSLDDPELNAGVIDTGERQEVLVETDQTERVDCEDGECARVPVTESVATVNVFTVDADRFVSERDGQRYDVVIVDLPDPNSVELAKLYSEEFYHQVQRVTSPDGIVVVQSTSPYHAQETYLCIMRTMTAAGLNTVPYHANVPSFGEWGWMLGSPSLSHDALQERAEQLDDFGVDTEQVTSRTFQAALVFNQGWLESERDTISTLMDPVVYQYYAGEAWRTD